MEETLTFSGGDILSRWLFQCDDSYDCNTRWLIKLLNYIDGQETPTTGMGERMFQLADNVRGYLSVGKSKRTDATIRRGFIDT